VLFIVSGKLIVARTVSSTGWLHTLDHTSIFETIEQRWGAVASLGDIDGNAGRVEDDEIIICADARSE
jgi:hypothetical protein